MVICYMCVVLDSNIYYFSKEKYVMGKCTFKGGIHPYDGKELSKDKPIKELFPAVGEMFLGQLRLLSLERLPRVESAIQSSLRMMENLRKLSILLRS